MKKFETPILEVEKFEIMDVITTSGEQCPLLADNCSDDLGVG